MLTCMLPNSAFHRCGVFFLEKRIHIVGSCRMLQPDNGELMLACHILKSETTRILIGVCYRLVDKADAEPIGDQFF